MILFSQKYLAHGFLYIFAFVHGQFRYMFFLYYCENKIGHELQKEFIFQNDVYLQTGFWLFLSLILVGVIRCGFENPVISP